MDELERALRAVLDDPAQLQELRELAGSMGFSVPQAQPERAPVPDPPESEPKPVQAVFQQQPLPEPAAAMLRQAGQKAGSAAAGAEAFSAQGAAGKD